MNDAVKSFSTLLRPALGQSSAADAARPVKSFLPSTT